VAQCSRHPPSRRRLPAEGGRSGELGGLRRAVAIEFQRSPLAPDFGIGPGQRAIDGERAEFRSQARLDPARGDRGQVFAAAQVGGDGDIGDGVFNFVVERGQRQHDVIDRLPVQPRFKPFEPFARKRGVGLCHHREHHKWAVQFVEGWQTQPGIGRRTQIEPPSGIYHRASAPACRPVRPVRRGDIADHPLAGIVGAEKSAGDTGAISAQPAVHQQRADLPVILDKQPEIGGCPARAAAFGDTPGKGADRVLAQFPIGAAVIGADADIVSFGQRRAQLELAARPGRRRRALIEHGGKAGRGDHHIGEIARLHIGQRIELPRAAPDDAQARLLPLAGRCRAFEPERAGIAESRDAGLQLDIFCQRGNRAQGRVPAIKRCARGGGDALIIRRGEKSPPAIPAPAGHHKPSPQSPGQHTAEFAFGAAVDRRVAEKPARCSGIGAFQLDRARQCPRPERPRPAAARHPHLPQSLRRNRR